MTVTTEEVVAAFHSLGGTSVGERRKNLFLLLNKIRNVSQTIDFNKIIPHTPLEEKFKLEILIYFKKVHDLIELLKSENPIFIKQILRITFCLEAIAAKSSEDLLTFFSNISFNTKLKILNKLPLHINNKQRGNATFENIARKYGFYLATKMLPACSSDFILNLMKERRWIPTSRQLLSIIKTNPDLTDHFLKFVMTTDNIKTQYKMVLIRIAKTDPDTYVKLHETYNMPYHLGWRITRRIVESRKDKVITNPQLYYNCLHKKQIAKSVGCDFSTMYIALFPSKVERFQSSLQQIFDILKALPPSKINLNILLDAFFIKYGQQFWEYSDCVTPEILQMLTTEERLQILKPEYQHDMSDDQWMCYSSTEQSIPYLKQKVLLSSDIKSRAEVMELLVQTCKINSDKAALAELCQYMTNQHRNDHSSVRLAFLRRIRKSFGLENLEEAHWIPIIELIKLFELNDETFYHYHEFLEPYIRFRLNNDLTVQDQLVDWVKARPATLNILKDKSEYEKQCLLAFDTIIPKVFTTDQDLQTFYTLFLNSLVDWNKRHRRDTISLYSHSEAFEYVKKILSGTYTGYAYYMESVIRYCIQTKSDTKGREDLVKLYLTPTNKFINSEVSKWLIREYPETMGDKIEVITTDMLEKYNSKQNLAFWSFCRSYRHMEIPQKIIEVCLKVCKTTEEDYPIQNSIVALSCLMPSQQFLQFVDAYKPTDFKSKTAKGTYKIQQSIGGSVKYLIPKSSALDCLLLFCKGNYLRIIQSSLYSIVGDVNENKLLSFFNALSERSVSIRKQALHLTLRTLDKKEIYAVLSKFMNEEKNALIRKFIFKGCFKFFLQNPDDDSWELVKLNLSHVDVNDKDALALLMAVEKIPLRYFSEYTSLAWSILSKSDNTEDRLYDMADFLHSISSDRICSLPKDFCKAIVSEHLFKLCECTYFQAAIHSFTCKFLTYCGSNREDFEEVFGILHEYALTASCFDKRINVRVCVANFVKEFCAEFLENRSKNQIVLEQFSQFWNELFKPHDSFNEYLHLQITSIYVEKLTLSEIGSRIADLCNRVADTYELIYINCFCEKMVEFFGYFVRSSDEFLEENRYIILDSLMKSGNNTNACFLLVVLLFDHYYPTLEETKDMYRLILENIEKHADVNIQLYLNKHLYNVKSF